MFVLSAKGATSLLAWGIAPGFFWLENTRALKARLRVPLKLNRAFSAADVWIFEILGRCPRLKIELHLRRSMIRELILRWTFDDRDRGRAHAEKILVGIFDFDANRETLCYSHPV